MICVRMPEMTGAGMLEMIDLFVTSFEYSVEDSVEESLEDLVEVLDGANEQNVNPSKASDVPSWSSVANPEMDEDHLLPTHRTVFTDGHFHAWGPDDELSDSHVREVVQPMQFTTLEHVKPSTSPEDDTPITLFLPISAKLERDMETTEGMMRSCFDPGRTAQAELRSSSARDPWVSPLGRGRVSCKYQDKNFASVRDYAAHQAETGCNGSDVHDDTLHFVICKSSRVVMGHAARCARMPAIRMQRSRGSGGGFNEANRLYQLLDVDPEILTTCLPPPLF